MIRSLECFTTPTSSSVPAFPALCILPERNFCVQDFEAFTSNQQLCNEAGELDFHSFDIAIRQQLEFFIQRKVVTAMR